LAVVSALVSCIFSHLIQSKILFELSVSNFFLQLLVHASFVALTLDFAANWVSDPAEVGWSPGRSFFWEHASSICIDYATFYCIV
jgi:hypothetical protein